MATIVERARADGTIRYTARVRLTCGVENRTFSRREAAIEWAAQREAALRNEQQPPAEYRPESEAISLRQLIQRYLGSFPDTRGSKRRHLEFLADHSIGSKDSRTLTAMDLVEHIRLRRSADIGGATALNELIWIGIVPDAAKTRGEAIRPEIVQEARAACRSQQLITTSQRRQRQPTHQELESLCNYFAAREARAELPMADLVRLAAYWRMRAADLCRLRWDAIVAATCERPKFTTEACEILQRQPKTSEYVFPFKPRSACVAFSRACAALGIEDLSFDDLRRYS